MIRLTDPAKIGNVLRDFRAMFGLTQAKMAELLGTRQGRYNEHETGAVVPSLPVLISYSKRLDFDLAMVPTVDPEAPLTWPKLTYPPENVLYVTTADGATWQRQDTEGRYWTAPGWEDGVSWSTLLGWGPVTEARPGQ